MLEGLQASIDYFDVSIDGSVATYGTQRIVDECFKNNVLCGQIELTSDGEINRVYDTYQNVAQATVQGWDMEIAYRTEPNFFSNENESFTLRFLTSYISERTDTPLDGSATDRSGVYGNPDLTGLLTANYGIGAWSFQMQGRYTDSVAINGTWVEGVDVDDNELPAIAWWNARIGYSGETDSGATWRVGLNIQNLFDKDQIIVPSASTRFGIQGLTGDEYGRRYNLSVNYQF
jgi:iron complex outermembrane receptor protein